MNRRPSRSRPTRLSLRRSRYPRLSAETVANHSALLSLVDALFENSAEYGKHTRKILAAQDRLQALCDTDAWIAFLDVEQLTTARVNIMLATVARWAFHEGRRSRRGAR